VWALGDCASVPNPSTGKPAPPTAQFAQREGKVVACNVAAAIQGGERQQFAYAGMGQFVSLGHRSAVAEILRFKVAGFPAWFLWRTVYLMKLPSLSRKVRVALDWTLDLVFGRDIAQLPLARGERIGRAHYEPHDVIINQGEQGHQFYVITQGEVEVVRTEPDGKEVVMTRLREGEYFGEVALLRSARRNATVRAVTAVNVLTMSRDDFTILAKSWAGLRDSLHATARAREN
jgi:NADH:ubiquinone reductase (H+-translocating)